MATYYIDYNAADDSGAGTKVAPWKRCPGMATFNKPGYSHAAGDVFVFKGGVTWPAACLPLTIGYSGSAGNVDTYTTDHTWYAGGSWSQPTFDGGGTGAGVLYCESRSYFTINDIYLYNGGTAGTYGDYNAFHIYECQQFTISNTTQVLYDRIGLYIRLNLAPGSYSGMYLFGNDMSASGNLLWIGVSSSGVSYDDVQIHHNNFHDNHVQMVNISATHGNGIYMFGVPESTNFDTTITNLKIYDNHFYGDVSGNDGTGVTMSGWCWFTNITKNALVYNNVFDCSYNPYAGSQRFAWVLACSNFGPGSTGGGNKFFNNTFICNDSTNHIMEVDRSIDCVLQNNISYGGKYGTVIASGAGGIVCDHNLIYGTTNAVGTYLGAGKTWAQWQALGFDTHGLNTNPLLVSSSDFHLQASSPCISAAVQQNAIFTDDLDAVTRGDTWDMGAYEYESGGAPPGLKLVMVMR